MQPYHENPPDRVIEADDIVFCDLGPIFEEWEADFGRTFVLGDDPVKHQLCADLPIVFEAGRRFFEANQQVTGEELFDHVVALGEAKGWTWGGTIAGHLVGSSRMARPKATPTTPASCPATTAQCAASTRPGEHAIGSSRFTLSTSSARSAASTRSYWTSATDMRETAAGDFDYESGGSGYAVQRRTDPRIAGTSPEALGNASDCRQRRRGCWLLRTGRPQVRALRRVPDRCAISQT